jgi:hypothetical protein
MYLECHIYISHRRSSSSSIVRAKKITEYEIGQAYVTPEEVKSREELANTEENNANMDIG